ncbi:hypothetical protein Golax_019565, partial [Gossypium laxum]|nr:hypothetical protein [Gossypium laxum]
MGESGGDNREQRDEISLLSEELIQLSVKGSRVVPDEKPTLICTIWTEKLYNPESFKAQIRSLWKTKKKYEIQMAGQNLYLIMFELEEDLELIMEGVTFGGVIRSEISTEWCRLKINLNVQKPLRRGIFVSSDNKNQWWISFKYEKLPLFCFGCGRMGHGLPDCNVLSPAEKSDSENGMIEDIINGEVNNLKEVIHGRSQVSEEEKMLKNQVDVATVMIDEKMVDNRSSPVINSNSAKKMSWKRIVPGQKGTQRADESGIKKRKATKGRLEIFNIEDEYRDGTKRQKKEQEKDLGEIFSRSLIDVTVKEDNDNREWR